MVEPPVGIAALALIKKLPWLLKSGMARKASSSPETPAGKGIFVTSHSPVGEPPMAYSSKRLTRSRSKSESAFATSGSLPLELSQTSGTPSPSLSCAKLNEVDATMQKKSFPPLMDGTVKQQHLFSRSFFPQHLLLKENETFCCIILQSLRIPKSTSY